MTKISASSEPLLVDEKDASKVSQKKESSGSNSDASSLPLPTEASERTYHPLNEMDLSFFTFYYGNWDYPSFIAIWNVCVAVTALLDFSAVMVDNMFDDDDANEGVTLTPEQGVVVASSSGNVEKHQSRARVVLNEFIPVNAAAEWLLNHATLLGFLFAAMWFLDAFMSAHYRRVEAERQQDCQNLLVDIDNERVQLSQRGEENKTDSLTRWLRSSADRVYYATILVQLLLLPVGFYVICYGWIRRIGDEDLKVEIIHHSDNDDVDDEYEAFTRHANISLGFALCKHLLITISRRLKWHFRKGIWKAGRRIVFRAVRNPFRFGRRVRSSLRIVRWLKYLAPLIGTSNKLRGNVKDLIKKRRQHQEAVQARRIRSQLWDHLTVDELREYSATLIQKTYRAHQSRKTFQAVQLLLGKKEYVAAVKLQSVFRAKLQQARMRLKVKKQELERLQEKERDNRRHHKQWLDDEERRRMYVLRKELNEKSNKLINEKLLLRPNTAFAVAWKVLFVIAVVFEISQLAFKPILAEYKDSEGNPLELGSIMEQVLIPTPVADLEECDTPVEVMEKLGPFGLVQNLFRKKKQEPSIVEPLPWYCESTTYFKFETLYGVMMRWSIRSFLDIVGIICFLDVFITFFTGEFNTVTGNLEPKEFFTRWILPGICLQLLVNPTMERACDIVGRVLEGLIRRGPFRVLRWTVALFFPLSMLLVHLVRRQWLRLVSEQNLQAPRHSILPNKALPLGRI